MFFWRTHGGLVTYQHGGIHDAVSHRGQGQAPPAGRAVAGDQRVADMLVVEVIENHPAVVQYRAVGQAQGRDLAHGVALQHFGIRVDRSGQARVQGHTILLAGLDQQHAHFTHEGRSGVVEQGHAGGGHGHSSR